MITRVVINGKPSRYRSEPQRQHLATAPAA
jgi:hypothetical protein